MFRLEMMITPFEYVMIKAANLTLVEVEPASDGALPFMIMTLARLPAVRR